MSDIRTEMAANRRRFRREGINLVHGDPADSHPHPMPSRYEIRIHPAFRGERYDDPITTWLDDRLSNIPTWAALMVFFVFAVAIGFIATAH